MEFRVLTLNCWGLRWISKHRCTRFQAIAHYLHETEVDFVFLQEVWVQSDFELLRDKLRDKLPYSKYFSSGVIGSGLCIFSVVPIQQCFFIPFELNGYFYKLWHGDWFSGKGVGLCQVQYKGLSLTLLTTHTHVETEGNEYMPHRVIQALCLVDIINLFSEGDTDGIIIGGDLNSSPDGLLFQLLSSLTDLKDSYEEAPLHDSHPTLLVTNPTDFCEQPDIGGTCGLSTNSYSSKSYLKKNPKGCRLDYILYKSSRNKTGYLSAVSYSRPLPNRIPNDKTISYSDHEGVFVLFRYSSKENPLPSLSIEKQNTHQSLLDNNVSDFLQTSIDTLQHNPYMVYPDVLLKNGTVLSGTPPIGKPKKMALHEFDLKNNTFQSPCISTINPTSSISEKRQSILLEATQHLIKNVLVLRRRFKLCVGIACFLFIFLLGTLYTPYLPIWAIILTNFLRILLSFVVFILGFVQPIHIKKEIHALESGIRSICCKTIEVQIYEEKKKAINGK